ncbi:cyclin N-terminal domain-containing protein 1-like [Ptychodera flava]|uniref:cyclin N-terminal domain-containing protein 1-like n=1 Tax=Ptychodera flava TaxID=63121 RepID=UPI00396A36F8
MSAGQIFGSPPEPIFNLDGVCVQPDLLEDILHILASRSEERTKSAVGQNYGQFCGGDCAKYIFLLCERFNQPPETRYLAVDIFDKFMSKHLCGLYKYIRTSKKYVDRKKEWEDLETKLSRLMCLRMVSSVQLASKLCSHCKILTLRKCQRFLAASGHQYTLDSIMLSELSILKTLDFKVPSASALTYIEALLEILGYNDSSTNVKVLHATCLDVLDVTILRRQVVYNKLCTLAINSIEVTKEDLEQFATVEEDMMFLAVAVIGAATYIVDQDTLHRVVDHISKITRIPFADILDFSNILIQECVPVQGTGMT